MAVYRNNPASRRFVGSVLVGTLVLLSFLATAPDVAARAKYSGRDLYRGIMLARGPVAAQIPEIRDRFLVKNADPQVARLVTDFHARLMDTIEEQDPGFMPRFATAMQSGDHFAIDAMLTTGGEAALRAARVLPENRRATEETSRTIPSI